uniref:Uncharacterized protein n=1 Tax=Setaria italica TaxID=4555 RepID=K3YMW6_SETIT
MGLGGFLGKEEKTHPKGKETQFQPIKKEHADPRTPHQGAHQAVSQVKGNARGGYQGSPEPLVGPLVPSLHMTASGGFLMVV